MRWLASATAVAALVGSAFSQVESTKVTDAETGFTFSQFLTDKGLAFRVAVPANAASGKAYDTVVQIIAPKTIGWAGLAWGGSMTYNPLGIVWLNGDKPVIASRMAYGYYVPPAYEGAKYKILNKGSHANATHYQITAQCTGCSSWGDDDIGITNLDPKGQNPLAFAYSAVPVDDPTKTDTSFSIHDMIGHWVQDFSQGANADLAATIAKNA